MILVTGAAGLVGRHVSASLAALSRPVRAFDLKQSPAQDVCDRDAVAKAVSEATGIIHLAAVSRVVDGERDPERCRRINLGGLKTVLDAALASPAKPWFVFASSREVYGDGTSGLTGEDTAYCPLNTYANTKVAGEKLVLAAREQGLLANIARLSTVYGCVHDHADRVLPAFCRAAACGGTISVQGVDVTLDPTHIADVARGLGLLAQLSEAREILPPVHFVSGRGMSLLALAELAIAKARTPTSLTIAPPRAYDVKSFVGDPARAKALLGWTAATRIEDGVADFVRAFKDEDAHRRSASSDVRRAAI